MMENKGLVITIQSIRDALDKRHIELIRNVSRYRNRLIRGQLIGEDTKKATQNYSSVYSCTMVDFFHLFMMNAFICIGHIFIEDESSFDFFRSSVKDALKMSAF